ncbi:MAG: Mandelate racemase/muconate lactonizing protein [Petrotoga mobilis]|nr:MAG: Mandelate racemase/muconate lactonizing protein [Petrotoga mobilis]
MKITDLRSEKIKIKFKKPFVISRRATEYCESVRHKKWQMKQKKVSIEGLTY